MLAIWVALFLLLVPLEMTGAQESVDTKDRIAAIVNDDVITLSELHEESAQYLAQLQEQFKGEELEKQTRQLHYKLLVSMIEQKLQLQQAADLRLSVSDREIDNTVQEKRVRNGTVSDAVPTPKERKAARKELILTRLYQQKIRSTLLVPESKLKEYYDSHQDEFMQPAQVKISQIMLGIEASGGREKAQLRADHVLKEIESGRPFDELAKDFSDGGEAKNGGSLGVLKRGSLLPSIEAMVDQLSQGETGQIIESPVGLHIIRVDEKTPQGLRTFEEARGAIESKLLRAQSQDVYKEWLRDLQDTAFIEILL